MSYILAIYDRTLRLVKDVELTSSRVDLWMSMDECSLVTTSMR